MFSFKLKSALVLLATLASIYNSYGQIGSNAFASSVNFHAPLANISNGCIDDFNGDGKKDIATVSSSSSTNGTLSVFKNQITGTTINSGSFSRQDFIAGGNTTSINCGDLDGDGKSDIVAARSAISGSSSFSVFANTSSGTTISFSKSDYALPSDMFAPYLFDIDGDGKKEIIGAMWAEGQLRIYRNTSAVGNISFDNTGFYTVSSGTNPGPLTCADFDGDGKIDVAVLSVANSTLRIFRNTSSPGTISFASAILIATSSNPVRISHGDLDNDGKTDLVVSCSTNSIIQLFKNTSISGSVSFSSAVGYTVGSSPIYPLQTQCTDLDADGKLDVVVGMSGQASLYVYKNFTSKGVINSTSLNSRKTFWVESTSEVYTGDLNGDSKPEIVSVNRGSGNISVLGNQIVPSNGLVAHYPFTGNPGDSSGYENHGSVSGATLTADRFGNPNSAYFFDGNTSIITVPANVSLRPTNTVSMVAWIRSVPKSGTAWNTILTYRYSHSAIPYNSYSLTTNPSSPYNNKWTLVTSPSPGVQTELINKNSKQDNVWMHIAGVIDGSTMKIYTNGVLDTSYAINISAIQYSAMDLYLGNDRVGFPDAFLGAIDDIKIYNRAISATEVWELYTGKKQTIYYSKSSGDINLLSTWGTNMDGTGTSPLSFDSANVIYYLVNNSAPTLSGSLNIKGSKSRLIVGDGVNAFNLSIATKDTLSCDSVYLNNNIVLTVQGHFRTSKLNASSSSAVQYVSTSAQNMAAGFYGTLIASGSVKTLSGITVIRSTLGMLNSINTNGFNFTLGTDAVNKGTLNRSQGIITGKFTRWFADAVNSGTSGLFPVGTITRYAPFHIEFTSAPTVGGTATVEFIPSNPDATGLPVYDISNGFILIDKMAIEGYWKTTSTIDSATFTSKCTANNFTGVNNYANLRMVKRTTGGNWTIPGTALTNTGNNSSVVVSRSGLTGLEGEYGIGGDQSENPLPVKLIHLSGRVTDNNTALISWQTASEVNADQFVLQRSTNKNNWENRNEVVATGNSSRIVNYATTDDISMLKGNVYYRLIQYDLNGDSYTSKIIHLNVSNDINPSIQVYPNPATTQLIVDGLQSEAKIYNNTGIEIQSVVNGAIDISHLPAGLYFIRSADHFVKFVKE